MSSPPQPGQETLRRFVKPLPAAIVIWFRALDNTTSLQLIGLLLDKGANPNARLKLFPPYRALGPDRGADMILTMDATPLLRAAKARERQA